MRVIFTKSGANTQLGAFSPGDTANVSDALAAHLVDDSGVAEYADTMAAATPAAPAKASEGLSIAQLRDALTAKGIKFPEGAKKPALADLLDAQA